MGLESERERDIKTTVKSMRAENGEIIKVGKKRMRERKSEFNPYLDEFTSHLLIR